MGKKHSGWLIGLKQLHYIDLVVCYVMELLLVVDNFDMAI